MLYDDDDTIRPGAVTREMAAYLKALAAEVRRLGQLQVDAPLVLDSNDSGLWIGADLPAYFAGTLPFPSQVVVVNVTNITDVFLTTEPPAAPTIYFNLYDNRLYIYYQGLWCYTPMTCLTDAGTVPTLCCPDPLPTTLHVTLSGALSGTYALTYAGAFNWWGSGAVVVGCGGEITTITLTCASGVWHITIGLPGANINAGSSTCDPVFFVFTVTTTCGNVTAIVSV